MSTIDSYIAAYPSNIREILESIRATVKKAAPSAVEAIKYDMPTFVLDGKNLIHFAAFKNHVGFYGAPTGDAAFEEDFAAYKSGKGSLQFPLDKAMPLALITKIVKFKVKGLKEKRK